MCRFVAYLGTPILASELLTKPKNSLIHQSYHALETDMPLNGDGFGLGWYNKRIREEPGILKSVTPAWNNQNLKRNAGILESNCFFAHIRAATEGRVTEENSHPFRYNQYMMMHNGSVSEFGEIKRDLINRLSNTYYQWIKGQTDSEHVFALFMQNVSDMSGGKQGKDLPLTFLAKCFKKTFADVEELKKARSLKGTSVYNLVITDGYRLMATRYSTNPKKDTRTLYYAQGEKYVCEGNVCRMIVDGDTPKSVLVVSEKLDEFVEEWKMVPENHALLIEKNLTVEVVNLDEVE